MTPGEAVIYGEDIKRRAGGKASTVGEGVHEGIEGWFIGILFEMEIEDAETVLRQAQDERKQKVSNGNTPFVLSLSKHEQGTHPQMI